jgi:hypothetical protein
VVAVDVEQEMLDEIDAPPNLRTVQARAEDVDTSWGTFQLVTIGNAFHWMDTALLERLPTNQVALLGIDSDAQTVARELAEEMLGPRPAMKQPDVRYEIELAAAGFEVEALSVEVDRAWTVDEQVGLAFSTSYASPERLGKLKDEFERKLRERLAPREERGVAYAYLGRRSDQ